LRPSHDGHAVIGVYRAVARGIAPVPVVVVAVFRRAAELVLGDAGDIAAEPRVVLQGLPRQRIVIVSDAEEAAEAEHGVGPPAADLVDHHPLDAADLSLVGSIDRGALNLVAADQVAGFLDVHCHCSLLAGRWRPTDRCSDGSWQTRPPR